MGGKTAILSEARRREVFGGFGYREIGGGRVQAGADWVRDNIVSCRLARANGAGEDVVTCCHHKVKVPLEAAFAEVEQSGLWRLIHSFDSLWVPRHKAWNPSRGLSSHSWGIAFDLNGATNPYGGGVSIENRVLNEVFHRYGFTWGGEWKGTSEGMHWEMADLEAAEHAQATEIAPHLIIALRHGPSFSYHAVPEAELNGETFSVQAASLRPLLGLDASNLSSGQKTSPASGKRAPLQNALQSAQLKVLRHSNYLDDARDPRLCVFVEAPKI